MVHVEAGDASAKMAGQTSYSPLLPSFKCSFKSSDGTSKCTVVIHARTEISVKGVARTEKSVKGTLFHAHPPKNVSRVVYRLVIGQKFPKVVGKRVPTIHLNDKLDT